MEKTTIEEATSMTTDDMDTNDSASQPASCANEEEDDTACPLFMEAGLPRDFATHPGLTALASLLDDEDDVSGRDDNNDETRDETKALPRSDKSSIPMKNRGGGKLRRPKGRQRRRTTPYDTPTNNNKPNASLGEAQLFLQLWKL